MHEQELRKHRCCFTGHRPEKLNISEEQLCVRLGQEIDQAIEDGFTTALVLVVGATTAFATSTGAWQEFDLEDLNLTEGDIGTETDSMKIIDPTSTQAQIKDTDEMNLTEGKVGTESSGMKIIDTSNTQGQIMDIDDLNLVEGDVGTENGNLKMFEYTPEEWNDIQQKIDNGEIVWQH